MEPSRWQVQHVAFGNVHDVRLRILETREARPVNVREIDLRLTVALPTHRRRGAQHQTTELVSLWGSGLMEDGARKDTHGMRLRVQSEAAPVGGSKERESLASKDLHKAVVVEVVMQPSHQSLGRATPHTATQTPSMQMDMNKGPHSRPCQDD